MKKPTILITLFFVTFTLAACSQDKPVQPTTQTTQPAASAGESTPTPAAASGETSGTVVETMNAAGYTYVNVDDGTKKIWAAAPEFSVKIGDQVMIPEGMAMYNYHSQTLNRDFPLVYFVGSILNASNPAMATLPSADTQKPEGHPPITRTAAPPEIDLTNVQKAAGGMTIGEIYADKADLSGKTVTLRGKVIKFSPQIMGTNWIHLQDGSGDLNTGTHDLAITSHIQAKVGDTLVASGTLTLDKDFGYGYKYDLIIENAAVTVE